MEVGLFSKCIKELIGDLCEVAVPHLGVFTTETMPASYSDKQTTINPPYLKISFEKKEVSNEEGRSLLDKIAEVVGTGADQAEVELNWCLSRLCSELEGNKSCLLPGLGTMKANSKNEFFFISDENMELYPEGLLLDPVSIRRRGEETARALSPVPATKVKKEKPVKKAKETKTRVEREKQEKKMSKALKVILIVLLVLVIAAVAIYLFKDEVSAFMDTLLYSQEELELLGR